MKCRTTARTSIKRGMTIWVVTVDFCWFSAMLLQCCYSLLTRWLALLHTHIYNRYKIHIHIQIRSYMHICLTVLVTCDAWNYYISIEIINFNSDVAKRITTALSAAMYPCKEPTLKWHIQIKFFMYTYQQLETNNV